MLDIDAAAAASSDGAAEGENGAQKQRRDLGGSLGKYGKLAPKTRYNVLMYLAEAKCMLGRHQEAFDHLEQAEGVSEGAKGSKSLVKMVETKFRKIGVRPEDITQSANVEAGQAPLGQGAPEEKLTLKIINKLNRCVVNICAGQFDQARQKFDEIITCSEDQGGLGLKEITSDTESSQMLPAYLINLLVYFYLRTNNLKMARALVKNRRFVIDGDHIVQSVK